MALHGSREPILPAGGSVDALKTSVAVTKQFSEAIPQVQEVVTTVFGMYTARGHKQLSKVFDRFEFNCVFDLPFFFAKGADRMRVISNLFAAAFDEVQVRPSLVSMQLLGKQMACIDVEAEMELRPRARHLPFASWVMPQQVRLHGTWTIVTAEDEKIMAVMEQLHNLPFLPRVLRAVWTTLLTTAGLAVSSW